jgi:hypothetical protein
LYGPPVVGAAGFGAGVAAAGTEAAFGAGVVAAGADAGFGAAALRGVFAGAGFDARFGVVVADGAAGAGAGAGSGAGAGAT